MVDWVKTPDAILWFTTGQPLGYYSSWPLFAINHHLMIWICADKVYLETLEGHHIPVSIQKSLVSDNGSVEFAKRFYTRQVTQALTPVSLSCCMNSHNPYGLMAIHMTYPIRRFTTLLR